MKSPKWRYVLALLLIFLSPSLVCAEKRYISDTLIVSLRDTPSLRGNIISYLRSGDSFKIIEEKEDGFILVQTPKGDKGWIQKKYTIEEKPKDLIIADLKGKVQTLKKRLDSAASSTGTFKNSAKDLQGQLKDKAREIGQLEKQITGLEQSVKNAESKYEDLKEKAQGVEEIFGERDSLKAQVQDLDQEVEMLKVENTELLQTDRILWFLAGFGVFLVGWIMGKLSRKSRRSGLSL
ncbi:MAG: TIGR04211 family SH3 domain-containing protein [Thermodesulfobacteriota bacterium]